MSFLSPRFLSDVMSLVVVKNGKLIRNSMFITQFWATSTASTSTSVSMLKSRITKSKFPLNSVSYQLEVSIFPSRVSLHKTNCESDFLVWFSRWCFAIARNIGRKIHPRKQSRLLRHHKSMKLEFKTSKWTSWPRTNRAKSCGVHYRPSI